MVRTAKVAICNREGREGRGEGGCRRCRRGIAAFEEIPTSGRNYPTANSRTVGDDDQLASESCHSISLNSTAVQKLMTEVVIVGEDDDHMSHGDLKKVGNEYR